MVRMPKVLLVPFLLAMALPALAPSFAVSAYGQDSAKASEGKQETPKKDEGILPTQDWIKRDDDKKKVATTLEIFLLVTVLAIAPAILVMVTSFTRIVIVLSFLRRALSTQELPPNQVVIGLSLVLTFLVMSPTVAAVKRDAIDPYLAEKGITQRAAAERAVDHVRTFMFRQVRGQDVALFMEITSHPKSEQGWAESDVPTEVLVPAFVIGELRRAFVMGFALFLPFLVIDMVIAALLVSMGMFMLPPVLVSLPFKILLFVLVDGWALVVGSLMRSFL